MATTTNRMAASSNGHAEAGPAVPNVPPREWAEGYRVLFGGYPATLLRRPWECWAMVLTDLDRDHGRPPVIVPLYSLTALA